MCNYNTKTVALDFKGETVERVIKADLDRVYITDRAGDISVYYDANTLVDDKHLFVIGRKDATVKMARECGW